MKGLIFSVKKYSIHDGPGIRVTFFMKGCPLSCWWCHNPEGISPLQEIVVQPRKVGDKEFSENMQAGKYYLPVDILEILGKEAVFFRQSGGGVTFSGGEPLLQPEFLLETLKLCKEEGYHTAIDTSGYAPAENIRAILPYTDLFLFDIKHLDDLKHIEYTGVSNIPVLGNFEFLVSSGKDIMVRIPVIPGINDDKIHLENLRDYITGFRAGNIRRINLLPFHRIGLSKYRRFGINYRMGETEEPSAERMSEIRDYFAETGIKVKIGG